MTENQNVNIDYANLDLSNVNVSTETIAEENLRSKGHADQAPSRSGSSWWFADMGVQIIQLVPFAFPVGNGHGWDFQMVQHVHRDFISKKSELYSTIRPNFPGFQLTCHHTTFGNVECEICQFRREVARFTRDNPEVYPGRWKNKSIQQMRLFTDFWAMAYVVVQESAGQFLKSDRGKIWKEGQKKALGGNKHHLKDFLDGCARSESQSEEYSDGMPKMTTLKDEYHGKIMRIAATPGCNDIASPFNGIPFQVSLTINPKTGRRKHDWDAMAMRKPLAALSDGSPDHDKIRQILSQTTNLRRYRQDWPEGVKEFVSNRINTWRNTMLVSQPKMPAAPDESEYAPAPQSNLLVPKPEGGETVETSSSGTQTASKNVSTGGGGGAASGGSVASSAAVQTPPPLETPTQQKGPDGRPLCYGRKNSSGEKIFDAMSAVCQGCDYEISCNRE